MKTQYQAILEHLRKHKVATVRDLLRYSNYPSARLFELTDVEGYVWLNPPHETSDERITRTWVQRNGRKVRLYMLTKA